MLPRHLISYGEMGCSLDQRENLVNVKIGGCNVSMVLLSDDILFLCYTITELECMLDELSRICLTVRDGIHSKKMCLYGAG